MFKAEYLGLTPRRQLVCGDDAASGSRAFPSRGYLMAASSLLLAHIASPMLLNGNLKASNLFQLAAPCLATAFCFSNFRHACDAYMRSLWALLASAFALWSTAQGYFTVDLLFTGKPLVYPSAADALWLAFALPILLLVVQQRSRGAWEWVYWLDAGQALLLFSLLGVLVFNRGAGLVTTQAYDVQGAALILLCGLRYSRSSGLDKIFFRNLGIYLLIYSAFSSLDYRLETHGWMSGGSVDLCWSTPPLLFILLTLWSHKRARVQAESLKRPTDIASSDSLYGTSALGLFLISLLIGVFLHQREPHLGYVYIGVASLLFAIRMIYREGQIFKAHRKLRDACIRDALTGLPNRSWLMDPSINDLYAEDHLLLCNIDRFKLTTILSGAVLPTRF